MTELMEQNITKYHSMVIDKLFNAMHTENKPMEAFINSITPKSAPEKVLFDNEDYGFEIWYGTKCYFSTRTMDDFEPFQEERAQLIRSGNKFLLVIKRDNGAIDQQVLKTPFQIHI